MKTKRQYITPNLKPVVIEERLLETISGGNQGGHDLGEAKWSGTDFLDDEFYYDDYTLNEKKYIRYDK